MRFLSIRRALSSRRNTLFFQGSTPDPLHQSTISSMHLTDFTSMFRRYSPLLSATRRVSLSDHSNFHHPVRKSSSGRDGNTIPPEARRSETPIPSCNPQTLQNP